MIFPETGIKEMDFGLHARIAINYGTRNIVKLTQTRCWNISRNIVKATEKNWRSTKKNIDKNIQMRSVNAIKDGTKIIQVRQELVALVEELLNATQLRHGQIKQPSPKFTQKHCGFKTSQANPTT